ncbi:MAG: bifunctional glutamate N-acetyltransferase/amino-acid acetyltransferase ArgJ [Nitrospirota bacterium]
MIPRGFLFSAVEAAIKKPGRKDLALIYSATESNMAGVFTTNTVKAAPVCVDISKIQSGKGQAIIINSGNANACTGKKGMRDAMEMTRLVAHGLKLKPSRVYISSTGVIGSPLPMERIRIRMHDLLAGLGKFSLHDVAHAIMTTDTFPKVISRTVKMNGKTGTITGICKGAGMICPHMATMLCFLMTDIAVNQRTLDKALCDAVKGSFNRITVDGDMSTNDTVLIMANGMLGNPVITGKSKSYRVFQDVLSDVTYELSKLIARDGEGATKFIEIEVKGARSETDAGKAAFSVANSNLVKTALYGNDANWGRIMAALGYSGISLAEEKIDIYFGKVNVVRRGLSNEMDEEANKVLRGKDIQIVIDLHLGRSSARVLTCDLTEEYIRVNATYRT